MRFLREWSLIIGGGFLILVLFVGLPVYLTVSHHDASQDPWLLTVSFAGFALGLAGRWWLKRPLGTGSQTVGPGVTWWDVRQRQARLKAFQDRAGKLCLVMALASYYLPALFVVILNHGSVADYLRGHLLDGFSFVGFLTAAWALVLRDYNAAVSKLIRSTSLIAVVAVYLADGRAVEIALAGVIAEAFSRYFWALVSSAGADAQALLPADEPATRYQAQVVFRDGDRLRQGEALKDGECLVAADKRHVLIMLQGELSVWQGGDDTALWSSGTWDSGADRAELDVSGRLVLRAGDRGPAVWATGMPGGQAASAVIESNGNLVAYRADDTPAWKIVTAPRPYNLTAMFFTGTSPGPGAAGAAGSS